ncbi:MAG: LamG-like jellyroll fold domain-containing protein, partial [archaeon]
MDKRGKIKVLVLIASILIVSFSLYFVLALETNYKEFDKTGLEYGKISLLNNQDIKLAEYTLEKNTDFCLVDCYAEGTATLYTNGQLFSDLKFKNKLGSLTNIESNRILIEVEESYQIGVLDYEDFVYANESVGKNVIGSHKETRYRDVWQEYNGGGLSTGIYNWRIEGKKNKWESVDWVASAFGEDFTEWAWWHTSYTSKRNITGMQENVMLPINNTLYSLLEGDDSLIYGVCSEVGCAVYYNDSKITAIANDSDEFFKVQTRRNGITDLINYNVTGTPPTNLKVFMPFDNNITGEPINFIASTKPTINGSSYAQGYEFGGANYWGGWSIGTDTRVEIAGASAFSGTKGTIITKFQADTACGAGGGKRFINSKGDTYTLTHADNSLYYMIGGTYVFAGTSCSAFWSAGDWVYLVFTWDTDADTYFVYVNNVEKASSTTATTPSNPTTLCIGGSCAGGAGAYNITQLEIYDKVLTAPERAEHFERDTSLSAKESKPVVDTTAPNTTTPTITPSLPTTISNLTCNATLTDDQQENLTAYWKWYKNNVTNLSGSISVTNGNFTLITTLDSGNTTKGEEWICEITPNDGIQNGTAKNSSSVTILNSAPTHTIPTLTTPSGKNFTYENITCYNQTTFDPDGDEVINIFNWYKDSQPLLSLNLPFE